MHTEAGQRHPPTLAIFTLLYYNWVQLGVRNYFHSNDHINGLAYTFYDNYVIYCILLRNILGIWGWKSQDLTFGHPFVHMMFILLVGQPQMTLLYCHPGLLKKHRLACTALNMDLKELILAWLETVYCWKTGGSTYFPKRLWNCSRRGT